MSVLELTLGTNKSIETFQVVYSDDADVVVKAKRLDQSKMDLESDVAPKVISGQQAERHTIRIPVKTKIVVTMLNNLENATAFLSNENQLRTPGRIQLLEQSFTLFCEESRSL
ncbi:hypothetical protein cypCar_00035318 [Cyprinus carpio]|nr:hypothetical protein cypCar_00035318 [Cyprinus carpio]